MGKAKKPTKESALYTPEELRRIANAAHVDPATVRRHLDGGTTRPTGRARIIAALERFHGGALP